MADRAAGLGGRLRVAAADGGGTELEWRVPVPSEAPDENEAEPRREPSAKYPLPLRRASFAGGVPYRGASPNTRAA